MCLYTDTLEDRKHFLCCLRCLNKKNKNKITPNECHFNDNSDISFPLHPHSQNIVSALLSSSSSPAFDGDRPVSLRDGVLTELQWDPCASLVVKQSCRCDGH